MPSNTSDADRTTDNRVTPHFFGTPFSAQRDSKKNTTSDYTPTEDPHWNQPPPPYTSSSSSDADPSAPPLELADDSFSSIPTEPFSPHSSSSSYLPPSSSSHMPSHLPQQNTSQYGAIHTPSNNTQWPWLITPSAIGSPTQPPAPIPSTLSPTPPTPTLPPPPPVMTSQKRPNRFCDYLTKALMLLLCISIVLRIIETLSGNVPASDNCSHGIQWDNPDRDIAFGNGSFYLNIVGGRLTSSEILIKTIDSTDRAKGITEGTFRSFFVVSPKGILKDPELTFNVTRFKDNVEVQVSIPHNSACVSLNGVVLVPESMRRLVINAPDADIQAKYNKTLHIDELVLSTSNSVINLASDWQGDSLTLASSNADVEIDSHIYAKKDILLYTTNGMILVKNSIKADQQIEITTKNGEIRLDRTVEARNLDISNSKGNIQINRAQVDHAVIKSSYGGIHIDGSIVKSSMNLQTSYGRIVAQVEKTNDVHLYAFTNNGNIDIDMPLEFEGKFSVEAEGLNIYDPYRWVSIESSIFNRVKGSRYRIREDENHLDGDVTVIATSGSIQLTFTQPPHKPFS